mmetsp:Transcript_7799/g.26676  ORF Transcript_7799/g.26676 Transcript_7799/m.26676 type:complete len:243 (-) Transcript_7799:1267-1995(-)
MGSAKSPGTSIQTKPRPTATKTFGSSDHFGFLPTTNFPRCMSAQSTSDVSAGTRQTTGARPPPTYLARSAASGGSDVRAPRAGFASAAAAASTTMSGQSSTAQSLRARRSRRPATAPRWRPSDQPRGSSATPSSAAASAYKSYDDRCELTFVMLWTAWSSPTARKTSSSVVDEKATSVGGFSKFRNASKSAGRRSRSPKATSKASASASTSARSAAPRSGDTALASSSSVRRGVRGDDRGES